MKRFRALLMLLVLGVVPAFAQFGQQREELVRAEYGLGNHWVDVTNRVRSLVRGDSLVFRVDNATMGTDPRPNEVKTLRLQFRDNTGRTRQLTFQENQDVNLRLDRMNGQYADGGHGRLTIDSAVYGANRRSADVTARLNSQIRDNRLSIQVNNDTMGGDPMPNRPKTLIVRYTYNGRPDQIVVKEGEYLNLPERDMRGGRGRDNDRDDLRIIRAEYGSGWRKADVTARLNSEIRRGWINIPVTNDTMGGDPTPGKKKRLKVEYEYRGHRRNVVVHEGDTLELPGEHDRR